MKRSNSRCYGSCPRCGKALVIPGVTHSKCPIDGWVTTPSAPTFPSRSVPKNRAPDQTEPLFQQIDLFQG